MANVDITIIAGNSSGAGLRDAAAPDLTNSTTMPAIATTMTTGSTRAIGLTGRLCGTSFGGSTATGWSGTDGAAARKPGCQSGMCAHGAVPASARQAAIHR